MYYNNNFHLCLQTERPALLVRGRSGGAGDGGAARGRRPVHDAPAARGSH